MMKLNLNDGWICSSDTRDNGQYTPSTSLRELLSSDCKSHGFDAKYVKQYINGVLVNCFTIEEARRINKLNRL